MNTWLSIIAGVLGISGLLGAALAVLTSSRAKTVIELQRQTIQALEEQKRLRDDELKQRNVELSELRLRVAASETQIATLTEMVTGAAKVDSLAELVTSRHYEVMAALETVQLALMGGVGKLTEKTN